jgi:hypothetical protein
LGLFLHPVCAVSARSQAGTAVWIYRRRGRHCRCVHLQGCVVLWHLQVSLRAQHQHRRVMCGMCCPQSRGTQDG